MLSVDELKSRTYEERMEDVMREIPIRSSEWTNYNASDPGITILENLTAFSALQGSEIVTLNYRAKMALLKMAGFVPSRGKCAKVLLSAEHLEAPTTLKAGERFHLGDLCFETNKETVVALCKLSHVYSKEEEFKDISFCLDREISVPARLFGDNPKAGNSVYFIIDGNPTKLREAIFYIKMVDNVRRNRTDDRTEHIFADLEWECFTEAGFVPINVRDYTSAFVNSGEIRISFPTEGKLAVYNETPASGYCIRATLKRAGYDIVPRMTNVFSFLFEVWQKDTKGFSQVFGRNDKVRVNSPIGKEVYYLIFAKEKKGSSYRRYELTRGTGQQGRYCIYHEEPDGTVSFEFSEKQFGYGPIKNKESVRVIIYNEEIMRRYNVGKVIGFDDQEIQLPVRRIVHETFFLIARRKDEEGYYYDFVRPERKNEGDLYYHLLEGEGRIIIEDPGDYIDADLFMGSVAVMSGDKGNIHAGSYISIDDESVPDGFYNPGPGTGGCFRENLDQVKERFLIDMRTPYRAVTAEDYEYIVQTTPGLCIRKAKAAITSNDNNVKVVVLPDSDERFPKLSGIYVQKIKERLSDRRLITSRFTIVNPNYVAVGVKATVYVKRHYADPAKQIEDRIRGQLDYINSDRNFGERLMFEDVFRSIEDLECVEYVYDLALHSENSKLAALKEYDIFPRFDVLLYPGDIQLEIVTAENDR